MRNVKLSIVIPILNEQKNLINLKKQIEKNLTNILYEVIFVDDNSTDNSHKIIKSIVKKNKRFKCIFLKNKKRDLSKSVIVGAKTAQSKLVAVMDGDLQHSPKDLLNIYLEFEMSLKMDIIVGCRNLSYSNKSTQMSYLRLTASKILIFIIKLLLGSKTSDPMSGFFIFKKNLLNFRSNFYASGFKILMDLIYCSKKKIKVKDYSIKFRYRKAEYSKMNSKILFHVILSIMHKFFKKILNIQKINSNISNN